VGRRFPSLRPGRRDEKRRPGCGPGAGFGRRSRRGGKRGRLRERPGRRGRGRRGGRSEAAFGAELLQALGAGVAVDEDAGALLAELGHVGAEDDAHEHLLDAVDAAERGGAEVLNEELETADALAEAAAAAIHQEGLGIGLGAAEAVEGSVGPADALVVDVLLLASGSSGATLTALPTLAAAATVVGVLVSVSGPNPGASAGTGPLVAGAVPRTVAVAIVEAGEKPGGAEHQGDEADVATQVHRSLLRAQGAFGPQS